MMGLLIAALVGSLSSGVRPAHAWSPVIPTSGQPRLMVRPCTTATELDCIESVGAFIDGVYVDGILTGRNSPDANGGVCCDEWRIPGLVNEDGNDLVETQSTLDYPGTTNVNAMLQFEVHASTKPTGSSQTGFRAPYDSGSTDCTTNKTNGVCYRYGNTQRGIRFQAVIRTSWMLPSAVTPKASAVTVSSEKLSVDGASRITVSGIPYDILGVDPSTLANFDAPDTRGAWKVNRFAFVILDTRYFGPAPQCAELPTLVVADNSWAPSVPRFDANSGVLSLQIGNPHFDVDGTTVFPGKYEARIPLETAKCMWGPSVDENTKFTLEVTDPTDAGNKATTLVTIDDGEVVITATGFHYSTPTIAVKADPAAPSTTTEAPTTTVAPTTTAPPSLPVTGGRTGQPLSSAAITLLIGVGFVVVRRSIVLASRRHH